MKKDEGNRREKATFGAGCFWHPEEEFRRMEGVLGTAVGYMGGKMKNPAYEDVCSGKTGHVEVVQVEFDPSKVSYGRLLEKFWEMHDPTSRDRQRLDIGTQYRSVIFYQNKKQKKEAEESKRKLEASGKYSKPIVTEIREASGFYRAEERHQKYMMKKGRGSCCT